MLVLVKIIGAFLIFFSGLLGGISPFWILVASSRRLSPSQTWMSLVHGFSSGVFLSISLVHMLLGASLSIMKVFSEKSYGADRALLLSFSLCGLGFLISVLARMVSMQTVESVANQALELREVDISETKPRQASPKSPMSATSEEREIPSLEGEDPIPLNPATSTKSVLLAALSFHASLTGLALGSAGNSNDDVSEEVRLLVLIFAVVFHKGFEAMALATSYISSLQLSIQPREIPISLFQIFKLNPRFRLPGIYILIFSLVTPVMMLVGLFWSSNGHDSSKENSFSVVSSGLLALASGTFLYVASLEIMPHILQRNIPWSRKQKWQTILSLGIGFFAMTALGVII